MASDSERIHVFLRRARGRALLEIGVRVGAHAFSAMVATLLVLGFLFDQSVRFYRRRQSAARTERHMAPVCFDEHTIAAPRGLFFDKSHTWAFIEQDGTVRTGIDDFLRHVTGPVTRVEMKNPGDRIRKGDPFLTLIQEGKKLVIHSPVSGTIKALNTDLITRASILHSSPYEAGWVYRIEPANWAREITLMAMAEKYTLWLNQEFARLKDFIAAEKREEKIRITLGVLEGKVVQPAELAAVARLPKKEVLIAMLLSAMQGPIRGVVYTLNAVLTKFVRVIAAIQDKRKGEGDMSATATKLSQEELIKAIESMSVLDLAELVKGLETRFGVTAAAPVALAAAPAAGPGRGDPAETTGSAGRGQARASRKCVR